MRTLIDRAFEVEAGLERCWQHVAAIETWPSWARHIRSIEVTPPGALTADTEGLIRLTNGVRSHFRMTDLRPGQSWTWEGGFLWLRVRYDHVFESLAETRTSIRFRVDVEGPGTGSLGRLFAAIYGRNLDADIPRLVAELE
jgi:uncharacterized membrane protein